MSLRDIKIPADASDKQTTDARSAKPPVEFKAVAGGTGTLLSITDHLGVQNRLPNKGYRIYFLPAAFAPAGAGTIQNAASRLAAQKVSTLVTEVSAPGQGTVLPFTDTVNAGKKGYYYCVSVNRSGVEAPPENVIAAP